MGKLEALKELLAKVEAGEKFILGSAERAGFSAWEASTAEQVTMHGCWNSAKALHDAVLPDYSINLCFWTDQAESEWQIALHSPDGQSGFEASHKDDPARAWLLSIIKALIAKEQDQ